MKIALLGTGFGQAHAAVYAQRPDVDQVVVFGRTQQKLATISDQFGFATSSMTSSPMSVTIFPTFTCTPLPFGVGMLSVT